MSEHPSQTIDELLSDLLDAAQPFLHISEHANYSLGEVKQSNIVRLRQLIELAPIIRQEHQRKVGIKDEVLSKHEKKIAALEQRVRELEDDDGFAGELLAQLGRICKTIGAHDRNHAEEIVVKLMEEFAKGVGDNIKLEQAERQLVEAQKEVRILRQAYEGE